METETFGVTYERYALIKAQERLAKKYKINTVLEIPAHGAKAAPSLYSLGFGLAGCKVTLVNPNKDGLKIWQDLGLEKKLKIKQARDLTETAFADDSFDLVWNLVYLPLAERPEKLIWEMKRISKRYVMVASVNNLNPGFTIHRTLHKILHIPWTHGNTRFNSISGVRSFLKKTGLRIKEVGLLDTPPWPDSLGFRDVRLHRTKIEEEEPQWEVPLLPHLKTKQIPTWVTAVHLWERLPVPLFLKVFYSHLFYILSEK